MQNIDRWLDGLLAEHLPEGNLVSAKRQIREKLLESYKNGLKAAGQSPAPRSEKPAASRRGRRQPNEVHRAGGTTSGTP